jgi:hypothetical protein
MVMVPASRNTRILFSASAFGHKTGFKSFKSGLIFLALNYMGSSTKEDFNTFMYRRRFHIDGLSDMRSLSWVSYI